MATAASSGMESNGHRRTPSDSTDAFTVDSYLTSGTHVTSGTVGLLPRDDEDGLYYCPKHPAQQSFHHRHEVCPQCDEDFQMKRRELQERRDQVQQELENMQMSVAGANGGDADSGGSYRMTSDTAAGILEDLQRSMSQWKPNADVSQPGASPRELPPRYPPVPSSNSEEQKPPVHIETVEDSSVDLVEETPPPYVQSPPQTHPVHSASAAYGGNGMPNGMANVPTSMPPPPSFSSPPPHPTMPPTLSSGPPGGSHMDHVAMQIQGLQRMQDWMLWQKEQECQQLRQRLEDALEAHNQLRVDNALLQEKLHQQEQRMQHELKLIKLAAVQQRRQQQQNNSRALTIVPQSAPDRNDWQQTSDEWQALPDHAFQQQAPAPTKANGTSPSQPSAPLGQQQYRGNSVAESTTTTSTSHDDNMSEEMKDGFDANSLTWPSGANSVGRSTSSGRQQYKQKAGPLTAPRMIVRNSSLATAVGSFENSDSDPNLFPTTADPDIPEAPSDTTAATTTSATNSAPPPPPPPPTEQRPPIPQSDSLRTQVTSNGLSSSYKRPPKAVPPSQSSTPVVTNSKHSTAPASLAPVSNVQVDEQAPPTVPLTENITFGTTLTQQLQSQPQQSQPQPQAMLFPKTLQSNAPKPPKKKSATFVDDSASLGQTVASSTYGEDRQRVHRQEILDPYGDKGLYTGVILRSTGMPHGTGSMVYQEDHRTYDGEWRHGRWHGFGRATFANGDSYEGEYRFDQRHGRGRYEWHDKRVYDGMFREDKRHGRGVFTWPDGAVYEGEFKSGQRDGHGVYRFSDGGRYEGSWKDGRYNGFGICNWEDGRTYRGEWMNGMANGRGVETYADGSVRHDGQWIEDQPVAEEGNLKSQ